MAALNGGLGSSGLSNGTGSTMEALTQAYSGIQQYAAAALPTLYNQNLLTQQSIGAAGSQKEGECTRNGRWGLRQQAIGGQTKLFPAKAKTRLVNTMKCLQFGGGRDQNLYRSS